MSYDKFKNVFVSESEAGALIRKSDCAVVRTPYSYTYREFGNDPKRLKLRATIRNGSACWPGGYPLYLLFGDGEACCFKCARREYARIASDMKEGYDSSFRLIGCEVNYEDADLICAHCNNHIPSAYGND